MNMGEDSNFPQIRICQNGKLGFVRIGPLVNAQPVTAISAGPCRMKSGPGISPQKLSLRPEFVSRLKFILKTLPVLSC